jgi:hypothetical protein
MKIAHSEAEPVAKGSPERLTRVASAAVEQGAEAAREGLQGARRTAEAVGELQRGGMRQSVKGSTELGQLFVKLLNEQMRHNLGVATALGRTVDWDGVVQVQNDFVRASFERMSQLNSRYLEFVQAGMRSMAFTGRG